MVDLSKYYTPHAGQQLIHQSRAREKYNEAARRWGKGRGGIGEFFENYERVSQRTQAEIDQFKLVPPGIHAWFVVPSFPQGRQMWNELLTFIPKSLMQGEPDRNNFVITLKGQSPAHAWGQIEIKSAHDPETLQTVGLDYCWVSEAQDIRDDAMNKVRGTFNQPGRTTYAYYEGIPALWPDHWFWRGCAAAEKGRLRNAEHFRFTVYDNPMLTDTQKEEIEDFREVMTEAAWRRMFLAERSLSSGFFKNVEACMHGDLLREPIPGASYVAGLDLGVSRDYTVLWIMDADTRAGVFHRLWDSMPWPDVKAQIIRLCHDWGIQRLLPDATGMGRMACQELLAEGLPVEGGFDGDGVQIVGQTRHDLLGSLQLAIERETITFPNVPSLIRQLHAFQYITMTATGKMAQYIKASAPVGEHDDEVFALALALDACNEPYTDMPPLIVQSGRYLPTQEEANGGSIGFGAKLLRDRRTQRRRETLERNGIKV